MKVSRFATGFLAVALAACAALPALADGINARIKSVDAASHSVTVIEGGKNLVFTVTDTTNFVDSAGTVLATGLKHEDKDTLEAGVKAGLLKEGTRLSITYTKAEAGSVASEIKLRDFTKK